MSFPLAVTGFFRKDELIGTFFNGVDQYVSYDTGSSSTAFFGKVTIRAKVYRPSGISATQIIWVHGDAAYRLYLNTSNELLINTTNTSIFIPTDEIVDIAVDYNEDGDAVAMRFNGVEEWTGSAPANATTETEFVVGARISGGSPSLFFEGNIWDVEIPGYLKWSGLSSAQGDWNDSGFVYSASNPAQTTLSDSPQGSPAGRGFPAIGIELTSDGYFTCTNYGLDLVPPFTGQNPSIVKVDPLNISGVISEVDVSSLLSTDPGIQGITEAPDGSYFIVEGGGGIVRRLNSSLNSQISSFSLADVNGIAHDPSSNNLWILSTDGSLRLVDYSGTVLEDYEVQEDSNFYDHLTIDSDNILWLSEGDTSYAKVIPFHLDNRAFGIPVDLQNPLTNHIEGITFSADGSTLYIAHDHGLKDVAENNTIQQYEFSRSMGSRNATLNF